jgi:hypothetical protein
MPEEMGKLLTETVCAINEGIKPVADCTVKAAVKTATYAHRVPAEWETEKALAVKARDEAGERLSGRERRVMEKTLSCGPDTPTELEMELQGIRIGEWRIISVPGELYTEIGLAIKALAPTEKVLISEQTNGRYGYISPDSTLGTTAYGGRYYAGDLGYGTKEKMLNVSGALLDAIK